MSITGAIIMKAAVLHQLGEVPRYEDFPDPVPAENEQIVHVKAVALENVDKAMANGSHFASQQFLPALPAIVGFDGIGSLDDGRLVGFAGIRPPYGALAEQAATAHQVPVPADIDAVMAAAAPSSILTSLFPLRWGASLQAGETVLINGATGFSGKLAVQVARLLGAGRVIATGRNPAVLQALPALGADAVIDLKQSDEQIKDAFRAAAGEAGYHVILDFLWGHPTELLIQTLVPLNLGFARHPVKLIQIGEMAGSALTLTADALRTSGLEIMGGARGITPEAIAEGTSQVWAWLRAKQIQVDIEVVPLREIASAWQRATEGKRFVIVP
jgi:NADPH:quinone reductase-like Zn-dependent oxidoreductase